MKSVRMNPARARRVAGAAALRALEELQPTRLPIDPCALADLWSIPVVTRTFTDPDILGCLEYLGSSSFRIGVSDALQSVETRNLTIGHELGHCCLEGHVERLFHAGQVQHLSRRHGNDDPEIWELQADLFAGELLVPTALCRPLVQAWDVTDAGLGTIKRLAAACQTTLSATASRYPRLTRLQAATILSRNSRIQEGHISSGLRERLGWPSGRALRGQFLPDYTPSPTQTACVPALAGTEWLTIRKVEWQSWFGVSCGRAQELCNWRGPHGQVLTVLTEILA